MNLQRRIEDRSARIAILGDAKATLPEIEATLRARMTAAQRGAAEARRKSMQATIAAEHEALHAKARAEAATLPIRPLALMQAIAEALPPEAIVIDEALSSSPGLRTLLKSDDAQSFYGLRGGGIGWGIPAAIGVKLAEPARPVTRSPVSTGPSSRISERPTTAPSDCSAPKRTSVL